jgi:PAS domain-containing protein
LTRWLTLRDGHSEGVVQEACLRAFEFIDSLHDFISVLENMSQREQAEQAPHARENEQHLNVGKGTMMVAFANKDSTFRCVNVKYANFYARQLSDCVGRTISEVISEARWQEVGPLFSHALTGHESSCQRQIRDGTDDERMIEVTLVPYEREGAIEVVYSLGRDIANRRRVDHVRRESVTRLCCAPCAVTVAILVPRLHPTRVRRSVSRFPLSVAAATRRFANDSAS